MQSTLPWWGFIVAVLLTSVFMLVFGAQYGITGFQFNLQPFCQMIAGYMFPGRPLASKFFFFFTPYILTVICIPKKQEKLLQSIIKKTLET
jgi:hypothetical protein